MKTLVKIYVYGFWIIFFGLCEAMFVSLPIGLSQASKIVGLIFALVLGIGAHEMFKVENKGTVQWTALVTFLLMSIGGFVSLFISIDETSVNTILDHFMSPYLFPGLLGGGFLAILGTFKIDQYNKVAQES